MKLLGNNYHYMAIVYFLAFTMCIFAHSAECPVPRIVNMTKTWTEYDKDVMNKAAISGCRQHFKEMPCLKVFIKLNERDYSVICGVQK